MHKSNRVICIIFLFHFGASSTSNRITNRITEKELNNLVRDLDLIEEQGSIARITTPNWNLL